MSQSLHASSFNFQNQTKAYHGKVRDMYTIGNYMIVAVVSDRISAFDVILPKPIPHKGQVLNGIATYFLDAVSDIVPTWMVDTPHPQVTIGHACEPIRLEMVIRGYLTGHAWRTYNSGKRVLCGVALPEGMKEHDRFPEPIITPATKAAEGHDEDISKMAILERNLVSIDLYDEMEKVTRSLFQRGTEMARANGLILVDTKYEFGLRDNQLFLIDEIHTPDSSRYFIADGYEERQNRGEQQKQLSKEFVREWLMANGFMGLKGQVVPEMPETFIQEVTDRYIGLYEQITGQTFERQNSKSLEFDIENAVNSWIEVHLNE
ncbi:MAG: phosphoribosylaminoimidazolesuccinocarboxamide synthase [Crocinitomicaceae bacterium]|nr:phosphoribosylaminoimidazolesuccinocarboxamide synthase [Crocinitomicaceae bacterium]